MRLDEVTPPEGGGAGSAEFDKGGATDTAPAAGGVGPEDLREARTIATQLQRGQGGLYDVLCMKEPRRTAVMEDLVRNGASFRLRATGKVALKVRYGRRTILEVPTAPEGREFMAQHAFHIMVYHGGLPGRQPTDGSDPEPKPRNVEEVRL